MFRTILPFLVVSVSAVACVASGDDADRSAEGVVCPSTIADWKADTAYAAGAFVRYGGATYRCLQAHTALSVWTPDVVAALWEPVSCGGSSPAPTPAPTGDCSKPSTDGGVPSDTGASTDTGKPADPPPPPPPPPSSSKTELAPYFYAWGWGNPAYPFTGLADLRSKSGVSSATIAFVLAEGSCKATRDVQDHAADVAAFRAAGGTLKASFGGADGTYLESACTDDASLAKAISDFVTETGITDLDFDVEQAPSMTAEPNARRASALAKVQKEKGIRVAFTLPAFPRDTWGTPGGLTASGLDVVRAAVKAGVTISHVNLMTMDYGGYYSTGKAMGELAISAVTDAAAQLKSILPGLTDAQAFAMLGATPMIGQNDVSSEVFSLDDAKKLAAFAKEKSLGLLSFWAINRDQACASASLGLCSKVNTKPFEFTAIFRTAL